MRGQLDHTDPDELDDGAECVKHKRDPFRALDQAALYAADQQPPIKEYFINENSGDEDTITIGGAPRYNAFGTPAHPLLHVSDLSSFILLGSRTT